MRSLPFVLALALLAGCTAEQRICRRMESLCGTPRDDCRQLVQTTQANLGEAGVDGLQKCFAEAGSCTEAGGCVAAQGLKGLGNAVGDFFKGVAKGLDDKK